MLNLFRTLSFSAMIISFSTSVLALPPPSGDEADPKDNGKREKSDKAPQKPKKKRKANTTTVPNPDIPLPHAPVIPVASLSSSTSFVPAAAQSMVLPQPRSEKAEKRQPLQTIKVDHDLTEMKMEPDSDLPIKREPNSHHPIAQEIGIVLKNTFNPEVCKKFEDLVQNRLASERPTQRVEQGIIQSNAVAQHALPNSAVLLRQVALLAVDLAQPINIISQDELSTLVRAIKSRGGNQKVHVRSISLQNNFQQGTEKKVFEDLVYMLQHHEVNQLIRFGILNYSFDSEKAIRLLSLLNDSTKLEYLQIRDGNIGESGVVFLAEQVIPNLKKLKQIDLMNNNAGPHAIQTFLRALEKSPCLSQLEVLGLGKNNAGEASIIAFADILPSMPKLRGLNISDSNAGPNAMQVFVRTLERSPCLSHLQCLLLCENNAGEDAILQLANLIPRMTFLSQLSIGGNSCGSAAALKIAEALIHCQKLNKLRFNDNNLDLETMKKILILLSNIKSLKEIGLTTQAEVQANHELIKFIRPHYPQMVMLLKFLQINK